MRRTHDPIQCVRGMVYKSHHEQHQTCFVRQTLGHIFKAHTRCYETISAFSSLLAQRFIHAAKSSSSVRTSRPRDQPRSWRINCFQLAPRNYSTCYMICHRTAQHAAKPDSLHVFKTRLLSLADLLMRDPVIVLYVCLHVSCSSAEVFV